jgi:hypothetical protein
MNHQMVVKNLNYHWDQHLDLLFLHLEENLDCHLLRLKALLHSLMQN